MSPSHAAVLVVLVLGATLAGLVLAGVVEAVRSYRAAPKHRPPN